MWVNEAEGIKMAHVTHMQRCVCCTECTYELNAIDEYTTPHTHGTYENVVILVWCGSHATFEKHIWRTIFIWARKSLRAL